jgi:membrane protein
MSDVRRTVAGDGDGDERGAGLARGRGRRATTPGEISKKGWWDILWRVKDELGDDHVSLIGAGVAFYGLLALFPAIAALVGIWGLMADPQQIQAQIASAGSVLPEDAAKIITDQATQVASHAGGASFAALGGLLLAIYSASKGVKAIIEGLNIIYDEDEKRGFIRLNMVALALTVGVVLVMILALGLIAVLPAVAAAVGLSGPLATLVSLVRWPILFVVIMAVLAVLYRYAPSRDEPRWRWVSWGAVLATVLWILGSVAFSIYVRNFGSYNETYGSLGAVVILLMWFWLSGFIVLLGAELNAEMEHQTAEDTTKGASAPRGERGATMADTVGAQRSG